jgi:hypothetical protein
MVGRIPQEANAEGNASDTLTCGRLFGRKRRKSEWKRHEHGITTDVWMEYLAFYRVFKLLKHISQASSEVLMTTAKQLRSRMTLTCHVRF